CAHRRCFFFSFHRSLLHRHLHSFPTRRSSDLAVITLLGMFLNAPVLAQIGANVGGIVTDNSGAVLPGVTITITNTATGRTQALRSEEHTSELQSPYDLVCRLLLEKKKKTE